MLSLKKSVRKISDNNGNNLVIFNGDEISSQFINLTTFDGYFRYQHQNLDSGENIGSHYSAGQTYFGFNTQMRKLNPKEFSSYTDSEKILFIFQIARGLHFLHKQNLCHSNICLEAIGIRNSEGCLGDFFNLHYLQHKYYPYVQKTITGYPLELGTQNNDIWDLGYLIFSLFNNSRNLIREKVVERGISIEDASFELFGKESLLNSLEKVSLEDPEETLKLRDLLYFIFSSFAFIEKSHITIDDILQHEIFSTYLTIVPGEVRSRVQKTSTFLPSEARIIVKNIYWKVRNNPQNFYANELFLAADIFYRFAETHNGQTPDLEYKEQVNLYVTFSLFLAIQYFQNDVIIDGNIVDYRQRLNNLKEELTSVPLIKLYQKFLTKLQGLIFRRYIYDLGTDHAKIRTLQSFLSNYQDYLKLNLEDISVLLGNTNLETTRELLDETRPLNFSSIIFTELC